MKFLRDPLLHFVLLGLLLFGAWALAGGAFSEGEKRTVVFGDSDIELLAGTFERQWGRPPTEEEMAGLLDARVREEILYREALAVGLDRNDVVVRRRMVQKMEMLTQDIALLADPTDVELQTFFQENAEEYRIPPRLSFSHVYFDVDRRGEKAEEDARRLLEELRAASPPVTAAPERGDRIMIETGLKQATPFDVRRLFGEEFTEALFALEPGWQGPILSGYGLHLVHVGERVEARIPEYAEVRDRLVNDFNRKRRDEALDALYRGLAAEYEIVLETGDEG